MNVLLYSVRSSASLFNGGKTFLLVMMPLGGGRAIIILKAAARDHGSDLPSFLSFRSAGGGTWAVADCRNDVARLTHFSRSSGQHIRIRICYCPDVMFASAVCFSLRGPDRGARHVSSWGSPDGVAPDSDARHVLLGGGVPTLST